MLTTGNFGTNHIACCVDSVGGLTRIGFKDPLPSPETGMRALADLRIRPLFLIQKVAVMYMPL